MKKILVGVVLLVLGAVPAANAGDWTGNVNVLLGSKAMEEKDWEPLDEQAEFAIRVDFRKKEWPVNLAVDLVGSYAEDDGYYLFPGVGPAWANLELSTAEWNLGLRKIWENFPHVRPFLGGGLAIIRAKTEVSALGVSVDRDDTGVGYFLDGGVFWTLSEHFNLGVDLRYSWAEVSWDNWEGNAGGGHAGIMAGYHW
ncbi:MAG: porin family protein [Proteobacteria bacterium]|nr:porin family protein [Pseudomonadota bacterium]